MLPFIQPLSVLSMWNLGIGLSSAQQIYNSPPIGPLEYFITILLRVMK